MSKNKKTNQEDKIKVFNSYKDACEADGVSGILAYKSIDDYRYKTGLEMAIYAIFDNLSGYQCRDLMETLIKNNATKYVPDHIMYLLFKNTNIAKNRKGNTAYTDAYKPGKDTIQAYYTNKRTTGV